MSLDHQIIGKSNETTCQSLGKPRSAYNHYKIKDCENCEFDNETWSQMCYWNIRM